MPKLPQVTLGQATGQATSNARTPNVTLGAARRDPDAAFGSASGEQQTALLTPAVREKRLTLDQAVIAAGADPPVLLIHELTGTEGRQIALGGRALPYRGSIKFAAEMRIDESEYTGYPRVNQTVLGAREKDTEMNGVWKDRFLGGTSDTPSAILRTATASTSDFEIGQARSELRTARDLCDLFEDVAYSGRPLRVSWLHLARLGRLTTFEQNWLNAHDVEWKMTFKWIGRDEQVDFPSPSQSTLVGLSAAFSAAYADVKDTTNFDDIDGLDPSFADRIDATVGAIQGAVTSVSDAVETRVAAVTDPIDAIRRATTVATFVRDQAQALIDTIDGMVAPAVLAAQNPGDLIPSRRDLSDLTKVDPGDAIAAACQLVGAKRAARFMRHVAARQRFSALKSLDGDAIGVVVLHANQNLRDLARVWYDNPDDAEQIRKFNGFSTYSPKTGTIVFIPAATAAIS